MFDPEFFKHLLGTCKDQQEWAGPQSKRPVQINRNEGDSLGVNPLKISEAKEIKVGGKEEKHAQKACLPPFPKNHPNPSPTDLPARKKHDAVPPRLLNADPLAQIISIETVADVVIDDAEACALLDSGATADLMTLAYAVARNFDKRPMTELSDHLVNLKWLDSRPLCLVMLSTIFRFQGFHHTILTELP